MTVNKTGNGMMPFPAVLLRWLPRAAYRRGFDAVKLKTLDPRAPLVSYAGLIVKYDAAQRDIYLSDRRAYAHVSAFEFRSVSVGKTYRHPLAGGTASGLAAVSQQHDVSESEPAHVFDSGIIESHLHADSIAQRREMR